MRLLILHGWLIHDFQVEGVQFDIRPYYGGGGLRLPWWKILPFAESPVMARRLRTLEETIIDRARSLPKATIA